ncbi:ATP-grasp domain-containing protein [uncultured Fibrobacter sp.]|uniref:ATP-grasp domain-containing protein n=1 Tax=uncultured Fibrobacter sp. TaxID=261512 RepID=UPI0025E4453D|nr:ATP-grasp domain-containing protein [uncultured Fibrobacter sp.]
MNILITAIGSMSAACAISKLKEKGHFIVGCDIYPGEWHHETKLCDVFIQAPFATKEDVYCQFLVDTCKKHNLQYIIPLTDLEIDVINRNRSYFKDTGIHLCMQNADVLALARDKYALYNFFKDDPFVPSIRTFKFSNLPETIDFHCVAKPFNGRSSEGLLLDATREQLNAIKNKDVYIIQEMIDGEVFTVDYCRSSKFGTDVAIPRQELLRTKNGAGTSVEITPDDSLIELTRHIGNKLNINGCVNMEFVENNGKYYLIDINPRFSAGVAFSVLCGYDMINSHMACMEGKEIQGQIKLTKQIIIKKYIEVIQ